MHPERDMSWYLTMRQALGPRKTAQEIDGDFLSSGNTVFDLVDIKDIEDYISDLTPETKLNGNLLIFKRPLHNKQYYIGADVATGKANDYSAFSIMDRTGDEVCCFKGKISTGRFKQLLGEYGKLYNNALLAPECNDIGEGIARNLQEEGYPNLYYHVKMLKKKGDSRPDEVLTPGWLTTLKNRKQIIDELENDIRLENVDIKDPFFCREAGTFIYDE